VLDDDIKLDGNYDKPFRKDRNCFGGGVLVYVSTTLKVNSCNKSTFRSPVTTTCWVKLNDCSIEC
jgi:hypothetical protein